RPRCHEAEEAATARERSATGARRFLIGKGDRAAVGEYLSRMPTSAAIQGYSDRINHALAFAAKHHDQQVRKGTRLPYLTHPANVAVILTKYQQDDATVVAGILHDVIEDCVREAYSREMLAQRIGQKFGDIAL